jgi:predicted ArsR family transcriptional regulator
VSPAAVIEAARAHGQRLADDAARGRSAPPPAIDAIASQGYEPVADPDGVVRLRNCPFDALVDDHRELTCSMNLALLEGLVDGLGEAQLVPRADPRDGYCCVTLVRR